MRSHETFRILIKTSFRASCSVFTTKKKPRAILICQKQYFTKFVFVVVALFALHMFHFEARFDLLLQILIRRQNRTNLQQRICSKIKTCCSETYVTNKATTTKTNFVIIAPIVIVELFSWTSFTCCCPIGLLLYAE